MLFIFFFALFSIISVHPVYWNCIFYSMNFIYLPKKEKEKRGNWLLFVRIFQLSGSCVLAYNFFCKRSGSQEERFLLVCSQFYVIVVQIIML